jgi:hypothetical protein
MSLFDALSLLVSAAGVVVAVLGAATTGRLRDGLPMMLDLWVAAGLLRLTGEPDANRLLAAALLLAVRKLVTHALSRWDWRDRAGTRTH